MVNPYSFSISTIVLGVFHGGLDITWTTLNHLGHPLPVEISQAKIYPGHVYGFFPLNMVIMLVYQRILELENQMGYFWLHICCRQGRNLHTIQPLRCTKRRPRKIQRQENGGLQCIRIKSSWWLLIWESLKKVVCCLYVALVCCSFSQILLAFLPSRLNDQQS